MKAFRKPRSVPLRCDRRTELLALLLIAVGITLPACDGGGSDHHNIVILTIDTIRADHLGMYGYFRDTSPAIDSLAGESVVYDRCIAPMATTLPTHLSLMTGTYPVEHGVMANVGDGGSRFVPSPGLRTFAEFASEAGYATAAFVSATPLKSHSGIAAGFDLFDEPEGAERKANATTDAAIAWLTTRPPGPYFLWLHYFDPHAPYVAPPSDHPFTPDEDLLAYMEERHFEDQMVQYDFRIFPTPDVIGLYDDEIRFADREIGRLLESLRQTGDWEKTILVLMGDHGEGLGQHGEWHHGLVWGEQLHVPLLFRVPGEPPARVAQPLSVVDVIPTLFAYLQGIPSEGFLEQASGTNTVFDRAPRFLISQSSSRRRTLADPFGVYSMTSEKWKYIYRVSNEDDLFNLENDPFELRNLIQSEPEEAARLKEKIMKELERQVERGVLFWGGSPPPSEPLDQKTRDELKALGYTD